MVKVHTLSEAMDWFLINCKGSIICVSESGEEKEVDCYPDAEDFFNK